MTAEEELRQLKTKLSMLKHKLESVDIIVAVDLADHRPDKAVKLYSGKGKACGKAIIVLNKREKADLFEPETYVTYKGKININHLLGRD